jgi:hypothetical protein
VTALPLYRSQEFDALAPGDPRRRLATIRAADCWFEEGRPEAIAARLRDEISVADLLCRWRLRLVGFDVHEFAADDWVRVLDVQRARAAEYRPPERTPRPWTVEQLDMSTWREER